jgi:DNA-binding XRE family transcriptional regulator
MVNYKLCIKLSNGLIWLLLGGDNVKKLNADKLNNLGRLRENSNLDRRSAAKELGCSEAFLSYIERVGASKKPSVATAQKMCKLYKCKLEDIFPINKSKNTNSQKEG